MFYGLIDENAIISKRHSPSSCVNTMNLWADFESVSDFSDEYRVCPACGRAISNYFLNTPTAGKLTNRHFPDVIFCGGDDLIVSEIFAREFVNRQLNGILSFDKIQIRGRNTPGFDYYNTRIAYSDIRWDFNDKTKHKVSTHSDCAKCGTIIEQAHGIVFDATSWDGLDIFQIYNLPHSYWVSERMATLIKECKFKNVLFSPSSSFFID